MNQKRKKMNIIGWTENGTEYCLKTINPFSKTTETDQAKTFTDQQQQYAEGVRDSIAGQHPEFENVHIFQSPKPH